MPQVELVKDPERYFRLLTCQSTQVQNIQFVNDECVEVHYVVCDVSTTLSFLLEDVLSDYKKRVDKRFSQFISTMGNVTSRLCANSTPTVALSDMCQRMRCLVACCGSEVHIGLRDPTDEYQYDTPEQEEEEEEEDDDEQPDEPTFREAVL